jgi:hypothetical protein
LATLTPVSTNPAISAPVRTVRTVFPMFPPRSGVPRTRVSGGHGSESSGLSLR